MSKRKQGKHDRHGADCTACRPRSKPKVRQTVAERNIIDEPDVEPFDFDEDRYEDSVFQCLIDLGDGVDGRPYYFQTADKWMRNKR